MREDGWVWSTRHPKRVGYARDVMGTGRWAGGTTLTASDASLIAELLNPGVPKSKAGRARGRMWSRGRA